MSGFLFNNIFYNSNIQRRGRTFSEGWGTRRLLLGVFYFIFQSYGTLGSFSWGSLWEHVGGGASPGPRGYAAVGAYTMFFVFYL